ncbi:MAG: hypothetical protein ABJD07_07625 [Gemmatimonadaceae bacterium]
MRLLEVRSASVAGIAAAMMLGAAATTVVAQQDYAPGVLPGVKHAGSGNIHVLGHIPLGGFFRVMDNEMEQELSRPYVYVAQSRDRQGFSIIDIKDVEHPKKIYSWVIDNPELHGGTGGMDGKYFKIKSKTGGAKYYYVQSLQFGGSGPDADLGAVVADVTGLPDTSKVKIVARIKHPESPGGFHNMFAYKHSDGRVLLFATATHPYALVYDMEKVLANPTDASKALIGQVPIPENESTRLGNSGYHDFQVFYDSKTRQDKFYGAGRGGYFLYDVSKPETPKLITSIVGASGITGGHTFTPVPNQDVVVTEAEYQFAPLRLFDLTPGITGKAQTVNRPIGAWTADWHDLSHNHEVKWPFVFVSGYEDGLQVFNLVDPKNPQTVGWYYTCECKHEGGFGGVPAWEGNSVMQGAFGIKVRDADGLITISDSNTGFWLFKMDGFTSWKGEDWGMPNVSSSQDWDRGPVVATGGAKLVP